MKRFLGLLIALCLTLNFGQSSPAAAAAPYDASAVRFAEMMVPHHQQAVLISKKEI